jgi:hypothetical protein
LLTSIKTLELAFHLYGLPFWKKSKFPLIRIFGETWAKVNKNGTPERFKDNYKIPIVDYGEVEFKSNTGINEVFLFSNPTKANNFVEAYKTYIHTFVGI